LLWGAALGWRSAFSAAESLSSAPLAAEGCYGGWLRARQLTHPGAGLILQELKAIEPPDPCDDEKRIGIPLGDVQRTDAELAGPLGCDLDKLRDEKRFGTLVALGR
jgi:hypothetical protein